MRYILAGIVIIGTATWLECSRPSNVETVIYFVTIAAALLTGAVKKEGE
ncbi:Uncharacterised protein [Bacillus pumilus]|nr:Uncharacterised protein [Bacillus pumilus]